MKRSLKVLISGAGVAGPTLAYWLHAFGHAPTLLERAPAIRTGGYIVDFWGLGYTVAERMGLLPRLEREGYRVQSAQLFDMHGRKVGGFSVSALERAAEGRLISLPRGALSAALNAAVAGRVETIFGDEATALIQHDSGVRVGFAKGAARDFDLVLAADGLHSKLRTLAFGEGHAHERYLGYKVAAFEAHNYRPRTPLTYVSFSAPGRQAARFAERKDKTLLFFIAADENPALPETEDGRRAYLRDAFGGFGGECGAMLAAMDNADDLYLDRVSQIETPSWSKGRVALVGDAAACPSLMAGEGASLAMAAAYVLAGELGAGEDVAMSLARYEALLRPLMTAKQKSARGFAASFAPRTRMGLALRNLVTRFMAIPLVTDLAMGGTIRTDFELPLYEEAPAQIEDDANPKGLA